MTENKELARVRWACRRGMLELDVILMPYFDNCYQELAEGDRTRFRALLTNPDPDIYNWLMGAEQPEDEDIAKIITNIRTYIRSLA